MRHLPSWRARALHYTSIYLMLTCALIGIRYSGRQVSPELQTARALRATLLDQRARLQTEIERLGSAPQVRAWALSHGMTTLGSVSFETTKTSALPPLPALEADTTLKSVTRWSPPPGAIVEPEPEPAPPTPATPAIPTIPTHPTAPQAH